MELGEVMSKGDIVERDNDGRDDVRRGVEDCCGSTVVIAAANSRREKTDRTGDTLPTEFKVSEAPFSQDLQVGLCVH